MVLRSVMAAYFQEKKASGRAVTVIHVGELGVVDFNVVLAMLGNRVF